jgi:RimJ/RimL family protein N-acetyltransferase
MPASRPGPTSADWADPGPVIATPRLRLRPLTVADAPALAGIGAPPEVGRMMCTLRAPFDAAAVADWISRFPWTGRPGLRLGIERGGVLVGAVSLGSDAGGPPSVGCFLDPAAAGQGLATGDFLASVAWTGRLPFRLAIERAGVWQGWIGVSDDPEPEIFYALEPHARGQGLAREAVAAFSAFLLDRCPVPALTAGVFTDNPVSARVLEACGFVRTGTAPHTSAARLAPAPAWQYRLSRS